MRVSLQLNTHKDITKKTKVKPPYIHTFISI